MCETTPDSDHCYQTAAVQSSSPEKCEKIEWEKFKDAGSNPPQDKCYLQIAENTWDYSVCDKIEWGMMSYSKEECIENVSKKLLADAIESGDVSACEKLKDHATSYTECTEKLATGDGLKSDDEKLASTIEALKSDPGNKELQQELAKLKAAKQARYDAMSDDEKNAYFTEKRKEIMADVEDEDVSAAIVQELTPYRSSEKDINKLLEKIEEVTAKQKMIKQLDEDANYLGDQIKEQLDGIVNDKQDEVIQAMGSNAKEWIEKNGGEKMKSSLTQMESAMEKYEKWSAMYESMKGKYDKLKWAYDEVMWVYGRVDQINKMLAEGKIDAGKASVLKWAVLLDKWLEYATSYVPVFGSTISTISKETFGTVIEFAKKRATRTTAIDKCIEDPENCDPNGISAY